MLYSEKQRGTTLRQQRARFTVWRADGGKKKKQFILFVFNYLRIINKTILCAKGFVRKSVDPFDSVDGARAWQMCDTRVGRLRRPAPDERTTQLQRMCVFYNEPLKLDFVTADINILARLKVLMIYSTINMSRREIRTRGNKSFRSARHHKPFIILSRFIVSHAFHPHRNWATPTFRNRNTRVVIRG